jgi:hypothetical protein
MEEDKGEEDQDGGEKIHELWVIARTRGNLWIAPFL